MADLRSRVSTGGKRLRAHIGLDFCVCGGASLFLGVSLLRCSGPVVYDVYLVAYNDTCVRILVVRRSNLRVLTQLKGLVVYQIVSFRTFLRIRRYCL